jgi:hypothetical protein
VTNSGQKIISTLWRYRGYLVIAGLIGALFGAAYSMSTYRFVHVQRISIETQSSSLIQTIGGVPNQRSWNTQSMDAANAIRRITHPDFYREAAMELAKDPDFLASLSETRIAQLIKSFDLERFIKMPPPKEVNPGNLAWVVASAVSFREDDADGIEIRASHMSAVASAKIAAVSATVGRDFLIRESLAEVEQAIVYITKEVSEAKERIREEDAKLIGLVGSSGDIPNFDTVVGEEQHRLSRDILSAQIEIKTNSLLLELFGRPDDKGSDKFTDDIERRSSLARINELLKSYKLLDTLKARGNGTETYEIRQLEASIKDMEKVLAGRGYSEQTIKNILLLSGSEVSLEELTRKNKVLKSQLKVARELLSERAGLSRRAHNISLERESIGRARGLLYKNLEFLNSQRFDLELKKISIKNKYSTRADQQPSSATRTPSVRNMTVFFAIFGLGCASVLILTLSSNDPLVMNMQDLPGFTPQQNLGSIHCVSSRLLKSRQLSPQVVNDLKRIAQRLFRLVRVATPESGAQVITVTSSRAGEGKSFVSMQLAHTISRSGFKVLMFDGDLLASKVPWSTFAGAEKSKVDDLEIYHLERGPDLVRCQGKTYHEVGQYMRSAAWEKLRSQYNVIIVDLPPIILVPEVAELAGLADRGIFVVASGRHLTTTVSQAFEVYTESLKVKPLLLLNFSREFRLHNSNVGYQGYNDYLYSTRNANWDKDPKEPREKMPAA